MYLVIVALTIVILPLGSIFLSLRTHSDAVLIDLIGQWYVVWGVGARLGLAGLRQILKPEFTARDIFGLSGDGALVIVRELGFANLAIGVVGLLAFRAPSFALPAAIYAAIFYAAAGAMHVQQRNRGRNENIAMVSDLFIAFVLGGFVVARMMGS